MVKKLAFLIICSPSLALGDFVEVQSNANVYTEPRSTSNVVLRIRIDDPDAQLQYQVAEDALHNGYHHIFIGSVGQDGWIYKSRVRRFPGNLDIDVEDVDTFFGGLPDHGAVEDVVTVVDNIGYSAAYSETKWTPLWVSYYLGPDQPYHCPRLSRFLIDSRTEARITHRDYSNSGYDRGHMAPSHNIGSRYGCDAQRETYFMSNISPQIPLLNQRPWGAFERVVSSRYAQTFGGVWVITGPIFDDEEVTMLCSAVEIPVAFYKIIVREIGGSPDVLAIIADQDTQPDVPIRDLVETVDTIEDRTGLDFFSELEDTIEIAIEGSEATEVAWLLDTTLDTSFRPTPRDFCIEGPIRREDFVW